MDNSKIYGLNVLNKYKYEIINTEKIPQNNYKKYNYENNNYTKYDILIDKLYKTHYKTVMKNNKIMRKNNKKKTNSKLIYNLRKNLIVDEDIEYMLQQEYQQSYDIYNNTFYNDYDGYIEYGY